MIDASIGAWCVAQFNDFLRLKESGFLHFLTLSLHLLVHTPASTNCQTPVSFSKTCCMVNGTPYTRELTRVRVGNSEFATNTLPRPEVFPHTCLV